MSRRSFRAGGLFDVCCFDTHRHSCCRCDVEHAECERHEKGFADTHQNGKAVKYVCRSMGSVEVLGGKDDRSILTLGKSSGHIEASVIGLTVKVERWDGVFFECLRNGTIGEVRRRCDTWIGLCLAGWWRSIPKCPHGNVFVGDCGFFKMQEDLGCGVVLCEIVHAE